MNQISTDASPQFWKTKQKKKKAPFLIDLLKNNEIHLGEHMIKIVLNRKRGLNTALGWESEAGALYEEMGKVRKHSAC